MTRRKASSSGNGRLNAASRKCFLDHLAQTANVAASARKAKIHGATAYAERRRLADFRAEWSDALAEGYVRLETELLAEALSAGSIEMSDAELKAKLQKQRLQLGLLNAHRGAAKGRASPAAEPARNTDLPTLKAQLILTLTQMRARADLPLGASGSSETGNGDG